MDHEHIDIEGINVPRDITELVKAAKNARLTISEQVQIGYALEMWHAMAVKSERAIHRIAKGEPLE
jgi:hypothetical protein